MSILDLLYPKKCIGCKAQDSYFCTKCQNLAKLRFPQVCPVCERSSIDGVTHVNCKKKGYVPEALFSIWSYEGTPRALIQKLKYKFVSDMGEELSRAALRITFPDWTKQEFIVVPVATHWIRHNWRGFNQAEEIAKQIANTRGWRMMDLLTRNKYTSSQVGKSEGERKKNISGVFSLNPNYLTFRTSNVLMFDDVWTTGATMLEAVCVLKKAGFKKVWCLTLCR